MEDCILLDRINIKTLPEAIVNYIKHYDVKTILTSVRTIYSTILNEISCDITASYLNKIQKYLSSNEAVSILIFDDINNDIYNEELKKACSIIVAEINKTNNDSFYYNLLNDCKFLHFTETELDMLSEYLKINDFTDFIYCLFKHAIKNYKTNTPKILAERIYIEANTLYADCPSKKHFYKISADLGHSEAALAYANYIYNNLDERIRYFLKGKDLSSGLWEIGFIIEHFEITKNQLEWIKRELKDILHFSKSCKECDVIALNVKDNFEKDCIKTAFEIYYYIAIEKNFSKGYNSLGKFLTNFMVAYHTKDKIDKEKTISEGIKYLNKAISLGNIHAMQNLSIYYIENDPNNKYIKPLLEIGAKCEDLTSCVELSNVLLKENKVNEAMEYLIHAASRKNANAQYELGKLYANRLDFENAKKYYIKAIKNGMQNATIDLSILYFNEYVDSTENDGRANLLYAINTLENQKCNLKNQDLERANILLSEWKTLLKSDI